MKPTIEVTGKKIFLLSGYSTLLKAGSRKIEALDDLRRSANKNPDAVAFGFTAGRWIPAA